MENNIFKNFKLYTGILWFLLAFTLFLQTSYDMPFAEALTFTASFIVTSFTIVMFLCRKILPRALREERMGQFAVYFTVSVLFMALVYTLIVKGIYQLELKGVFQETDVTTRTDRPFHVEYINQFVSSLIISTAFCGLQFYREHNLIWQENVKMKQLHLEEQVRFLQNQINPHLMFNVLNHIHILMQNNVELASDLLVKFSDILRYQLYDYNQTTVRLDKEVEYLENIIEVEKVRWGDQLRVTCNWEIENGSREVSPLLLIPFIENAFKHVSHLPSDRGYIDIEL